MNKQIKLIILAIISLIVVYIYAINNIFRFSMPSGFYEEDFYLKIIAPTNEIYYTLDGSIPTKASILYTEPILITDASLNENVYSMREDLSTFLLEDLIIKYNNDPDYISMYNIPDYLVDKCTIIRAVYYDSSGVAQELNTATYFVGYSEKAGYDTDYTISIVTEPDNLFSDDIGIYVLGDTFDEYLKSADLNGINFAIWNTNYLNRGRDWEREAVISLFDQDGNHVLEKDIGVRIQGGYSRSNASKSLNIYSRDEYDGTKIIEYPMWDNSDYQPDVFTIASGGNDVYTKFKDRLVSELCQNLDVSVFNYEPATLFLNGEYWGLYHIAEKYTSEYFNYYYDIEPDNLVLIKGGELEEGTEENYQEFLDMYDFLNDADLDLTIKENYEYLWSIMDKSSTIDHFALKLYFGRTSDWMPLGTNSALWKTNSTGNNPYEDEKWRWAIYDMNWGAMHKYDNKVDSIVDTRDRVIWFDKLCENKDFVELLTNRLFELMEEEFQEERILNLIDDYTINMEEIMTNHYARFFGEDLTNFYKLMEDTRLFFVGRNRNMKAFIFENFGIIEQQENSNISLYIQNYKELDKTMVSQKSLEYLNIAIRKNLKYDPEITYIFDLYLENTKIELSNGFIIYEGRTYMPIREISGLLGASVGWDNHYESAIIEQVLYNGDIIRIETPVNYNKGIITKYSGVNGERYFDEFASLDSDNSDIITILLDGTTYLPLRFIAENFGYTVNYVDEFKEIYLNKNTTFNDNIDSLLQKIDN